MINHNGVTTNTNNNIVVTKLQNQQSREMQESNFGIIEGNLINFDGIKTSQHTQFGHTFPYLQSNMYKSTNGAIAYCLDDGLYGASGTDNAYNNTNQQLSASTLYMLANGYNGTQESLNRFTKWEGWGFTQKEAFEATQLAIWASDNAKPDCRINLNDLYYTDTQGKAVIQAAKELYNEAQNASTNLTISGNLHFAQVNGSEETYGPFTVSAGLPLSSYTVSVSGNPTAEVVNANGQAITGPISAGTPFYIKVSNQNVAKTTISVTATTAIKNGVIQSNGQNYYQNYANETSANVTLSNNLSFEPKVAPIKNTPKPAPAPKVVTPAPKVTNSNVNKPSNKNEQHQSQTQTVNNKPSVKNSNVASPKNTNKEEQQQTSKVNNHPVINNHPTNKNTDDQSQSDKVNNHPTINNKPTNKQSIDNHPTNTNKNDITVSPNQSNKNTFSPIIKINIYNDNNNSNSNTNANANGNGSKATGNSNANSNSNANGAGSKAKAGSVVGDKGGNSNSNANSNANANGNGAGAGSKAKAGSVAKGGNANSNANANGNGTGAGAKAKADSVAKGGNANSNANANGNGTSVKADSITAGGNANSNANANANSNSNSNTVKVSKGVISTSTSTSESPASASASASVSTPGSSPVSVSASSPVATSAGTTASASATTPAATPADASSTVVSGSQTTGLPFTGLTTSQVSSHANSDLAYGGLFAILAVIASIFGIKKFK